MKINVLRFLNYRILRKFNKKIIDYFLLKSTEKAMFCCKLGEKELTRMSKEHAESKSEPGKKLEEGAKLEDWDKLEGAKLEGAKLEGAKLEEAKLEEECNIGKRWFWCK